MKNVDIEKIETGLGLEMPATYKAMVTETDFSVYDHGPLEALDDAGEIIEINRELRKSHGEMGWADTFFCFCCYGDSIFYYLDLLEEDGNVYVLHDESEGFKEYRLEDLTEWFEVEKLRFNEDKISKTQPERKKKWWPF